MNTHTPVASAIQSEFWQAMETRLKKYDLLCHPFYQAWSEGKLTRDDLRQYAAQYYHHVAAFPTYLSALHSRLEDGALRRAVLQNLYEEEMEGTAHSDLWMRFAEGFGASDAEVRAASVCPELAQLIATFRIFAASASPVESLAAFYAYESQIPRVAQTKAQGLKELYGSDARTSSYFTLHQTADILHSNVWRDEINKQLTADPSCADSALDAAENAAKALWTALDGIERERISHIQ